MKNVSFSFSADVSVERRRELLERVIPRVPGVSRAGAVRPDSRSERIRRMSFAVLTDEADENDVIARLRKMPELESIEVPPQRMLVE